MVYYTLSISVFHDQLIRSLYTDQDNNKKKKKTKSGTKSKSKSDKSSSRKSVKEMMAEYSKQKPKGAKTNDTVSFYGD